MKFVHIGTRTRIEGVAENLDRYGQEIELAEDLARDLIAPDGGALLLPVELFTACGFTAAELAQWANPNAHSDAPPDVQQKLYRARVAFHEMRLRLQAGGDFFEQE